MPARSCFCAHAGLASFWFVKWLNTIPNSHTEDAVRSRFSMAVIGLAGVLVVIAILGLGRRRSSVTLACCVAVIFSGLIVVGFGLISALGYVAFLLTNGYVLVAPVAFFAAAAVRAVIDVWKKKSPMGELVVPVILAGSGFAVCLYLALCLDKSIALAWGMAD